MSIKSTADLTTQNNAVIVNQTQPDSITPALLGGFEQNIIDSMYNRIDDKLLPAPTEMTRAQLATAILGSLLFDKQWIKITDRLDTNPLFVMAQGTATISPFGIWVVSGKPIAVVMDYVGTYEGETQPFLSVFSGTDNRNLKLSEKIIIADASKGAGKILVSDADGVGTWTDKTPSVTVSINVPSLIAGGNYSQTVSLPGVVDGDIILIGIKKAVGDVGAGFILFSANYSAVDTIDFNAINTSQSTTLDLPVADYKFTILR